MRLVHILVFIGFHALPGLALEVTPPVTTWVKQEQADVKLICTASEAISTCMWTTAYGKSYNFFRPGLSAEGGRLTHIAENAETNCGIVISSIEEKDAGHWQCEVSTVVNNELVTASALTKVGFMQAPSGVALAAPFNTESANVTAGEPSQVKCVATNAKAKPEFNWILLESGEPEGDEIGSGIEEESHEITGETKDQEDMLDADGLSTFSQTLTYIPEESHNGMTLQCVVRHPGMNNELEAGVKLLLLIEEPDPPKLSPGATIGIVVAVLIILSIATILFILYRMKTAKNRDDPECGTDPEKIALTGGDEEEEPAKEEKVDVNHTEEVNEVTKPTEEIIKDEVKPTEEVKPVEQPKEAKDEEKPAEEEVKPVEQVKEATPTEEVKEVKPTEEVKEVKPTEKVKEAEEEVKPPEKVPEVQEEVKATEVEDVKAAEEEPKGLIDEVNEELAQEKGEKEKEKEEEVEEKSDEKKEDVA